jgi:HSP20 family protein
MNTSLLPFGTRFGLSTDIQRELDNLLGRFFEGGNGSKLMEWKPEVNISETEGQYEVHIDLPGMKPEDFTVELRHGDLWISGERKEETEEKGKTWHRMERRYGQFRRILPLGQEVDPEKIEAEYKEGVLRVVVPKSEVAQPKKVTVKT